MSKDELILNIAKGILWGILFVSITEIFFLLLA